MKKSSVIPKNLKLTSVVAEREYELTTATGKKKRVVARFGKPRPLRDRSGSYCVYQIDGYDDSPHPRFAPGVDSVQALLMAMQMAWIDLMSSEAYRRRRLTFLGVHDLGLPRMELKVVKKPARRRDRASRGEAVGINWGGRRRRRT